MGRRTFAAAFLIVAASAAPNPVLALTGPGGCSGLPEYYRAEGALQGMTAACNMTIDEARHVLATYDAGTAGASSPPTSPTEHRRHRLRRH